MIKHEPLWKQQGSSPLILMISGITGTKKHQYPGYLAMAGFFWLHGPSCYITESSKQNGHGYYSLKSCYDKCTQAIAELSVALFPSSIILFGCCSGATIATHLAANLTLSLLLLYETWPEYPIVKNTKK